ncbi:MAG: hypothetical protein OXC13_17385 [Caldilineaceae bacterium]|nr:hypothetical protein [Caldilineaceae bacterium]
MSKDWFASFGLALLIASAGASGNAFFAWCQRKAILGTMPLVFVAMVAATFLFGAIVTVAILARLTPGEVTVAGWPWAMGGGLGLYITVLCFYFLYTRFGTAYYALYAVLSILTTTLFVGQVVLREPINRFHLVSIALAIGAVVTFSLASNRPTQ